MNLLKDFKSTYELVECENYKISKKEKLIREIKREIKEVSIRENLDIKKITKKIKGEECKVNENRLNTHGSFRFCVKPYSRSASLMVSIHSLQLSRHPYNALSNFTIIRPFFMTNFLASG